MVDWQSESDLDSIRNSCDVSTSVVYVDFRGGICPCRQCRRQCKIFASRVNFSIFTHFLCFFPPTKTVEKMWNWRCKIFNFKIRRCKFLDKFHVCQPPSPQHITSLLKKISTEVIHPHVSKLPGLLLLVVLAVHSAVDHQTKWAKSRQVGYPRNGLLMNTKDIQSSCLWVGHCWKEPNLQNPPLATDR